MENGDPIFLKPGEECQIASASLWSPEKPAWRPMARNPGVVDFLKITEESSISGASHTQAEGLFG